MKKKESATTSVSDARPVLVAVEGQPARIIIPHMELDVYSTEMFMLRLVDCVDDARKHDGEDEENVYDSRTPIANTVNTIIGPEED